MKVLALDVGEKRIGVAQADSTTRIAIPVGFVVVDGSEWQEIARLARLNNTNWFVLGLPRSNEGNETQQSLYVRNFAKTLAEKIPEAKIRFQDESFTSVEAEERLKKRKKTYVKGEIDAESATIILQDFLETYKIDDVPRVSTPMPEQFQDRIQGKVQKMKKKSKNKAIIAIIIPLILAGLTVGGVAVAMQIKEQRARERAEEYARLEAEMNADVFNFTVTPGETIYDIQANLIEVGYSETEVAEAFNADYDFDFLRERPVGATLEGYLYGETYEFYRHTPVKEILEKYLSEMDKVIKNNNLETRYAEQGLSLHEGITLASVVQKEAPTPEMPTVAQVFLSRIAYGIPLGSDVTVSYALDTIDPDRQTYVDNQSALGVDSCYNTRLHAGLPCGPISNPGLSALLAVAEPADSSYLYFLTGDDGMMYYSYTESEHNQNIYLYCQELCNVSL